MKILLAGISEGSLGKNKGCEKAPMKIIGLLKESGVNESEKPLLVEEDSVEFKGDVDGFYKEIEGRDFDVMIGGDHSVSYAGFKGLKMNDKCLIIFDAHPDVEIGTRSVDHECWLRKLVEDGVVKPENVFLIGLRSFSGEELRFIKEKRIKCLMMKQLFELDIGEVCEDVMEFASGFKGCYLSLDIDVVDPAFAPGTGYLEPGGLTAREVIYFMQRLKMLKNLKRVDVVEVNPEKDVNEMTCRLAAKIVEEMG